MKKLGILLLLTTVLATFGFAQVAVTGGFELANVSGANGRKMDPALWTAFTGAGSRELGPGSIGAELSLATKLHFGDGVSSPYGIGEGGDTYLKGLYALPAGPGKLTISIATWDASFGDLHFGVDYDDIAAGPVTLGLGLEYALKTTGTDNNSKAAVFGDGPSKKTDEFVAKLSAGFDFGLGIAYEFTYGIGEKSDILNIAYVDISFQVMDPLKVGIQVADTGKEFKGKPNATTGITEPGFALKPYVSYAISGNTTAGFKFVINGINATVGDPSFTPQLTIKHSF